MNRFPLFLDVKDRWTVIVGGGASALRKARLIIAAGGRPLLFAESFDAATAAELQNRAELIERAPVRDDFVGVALVFIALDHGQDGGAEALATMARQSGALVNVVDQPALCDFTTPSIVDRGRITVAISSDGAAPSLGRKLRANIERQLPDRLGVLAEFAAQYRDAVKAKIPETERRAFWDDFFEGPIATLVLEGDEVGARDAMLSRINIAGSEKTTGVVHIVGAGPGDPELLTLKAFRLIQHADVILYDRLVSDEILSLARRDADRIFVGKAKSAHAVPQREIEALMVAHAKEGKNVVRLKGGDPFVFGRGGEELDAMRAAGVSAFVTPGITAATGCAAALGMPLTHRDYAQAVTFVTGHAKGEEDPDLDWQALAALKNTLVVYMGVSKAGSIAANLIANGRTETTPVAVVENGARPEQVVAKGVLRDLENIIDENGIKGPALLVIGEVAALANADGLDAVLEQARRAA